MCGGVGCVWGCGCVSVKQSIKKWSITISNHMDGPREYRIKWSERQMVYDITYMWNLRSNTNQSTYKIETDQGRKLTVTEGKRKREG